jgi:hypothetical protein
MNMRRKQVEILNWFGKMVECSESLPPDERAALDQWDKQRPEGVGTSEWPGFDKYLPKRHWAKNSQQQHGKEESMSTFIDPYEEEDEFANDPDTKTILASIDEVIKRRTPQEAYDWLDDLENKIMDRTEELASDSTVKG